MVDRMWFAGWSMMRPTKALHRRRFQYFAHHNSILFSFSNAVSILGSTADYLERQRRKALAASLVAQKSPNDSPATDDAPAHTSSSAGDDIIINHGDGFSLLVTMDGNAYSQLPPHIKPALQNWLPTVGTLRSSSKDNENLVKNDVNSGWSLELKQDGWRLPRSSSDGPTTCSSAASCIIKQSQESADGMPEIFWSLKQ